ncbi:MAG TPA: homocysteine biosynthesis protein [Planctomycetota bacterium]|nr:homocysteine biosynthesis protein [Planctomycetota bacterium]
MPKTYAEINEKIRKGTVVVVTAEEMIDIVDQKGARRAADEVDVVTTGTFGPMCSSGAILNVGHSKPRIRIARATLNGVPAYGGLAAVDLYVGAAEPRQDDPLNAEFPGRFRYGGGHLIEDLVAGKEVELKAYSYGTDCYPLKEVNTCITLQDCNEAYLLNPRNGYQNYNVAVNAHSPRTIYTYMGILRPNLGNANYCSAGQLGPLLNDPYYRTIGIGTRIFLGGGVGYVYWQGTQHSPCGPRGENGVVKGGAGTLAVHGDLKGMSREFIRGVSFRGYGCSMAVGIGVPIPILNEEMARFTAVKDADICTQVVDYSQDYPNCVSNSLGEVSYKQLRSGKITIAGKDVPTASISSYPMARKIATTLKEWIRKGEFLLTEPVQLLPSADSGVKCKPMKMKTAEAQ